MRPAMLYATNGPPAVLFPFFVIWILLGVFSSVFFFLNKDAALKRKVWPWFTIGAGALFAGFVGFSAGPRILVFVIPAVALITILNLRTVKFCDACGKTIYNVFLVSPKFCTQCGSKLN